ncbi:DUF87 domain-containing protein, partial [Candidatus Woesearchaeota archaeon]|nr:DUF87 domain-containing protein [Candidatus Woesearchaeota archaeon]
ITRNKQYTALFDSHKKFLESIVADKGIMNRSFYIIIPEHHNIDIQIKLCEEKQKNLNFSYKRIKGKELKKILSGFFFAKGKKILPNELLNQKDYIKINDVYNRIIYAHGYPRRVEAGFLDKIISSHGNFDISLHINPYPIETMMVNLNKELQKQKADLFSQQQKGLVNPSLEIKYKDTRKILEDLQKGHHKLFNAGLYINCKAKTLRELDLLTKKVESELNSLLIIPRVANYRMAQGWKSVAPLGIDNLKMNRNVTTEALSAFFPFTSPFLQVDESGVWLGLNKNNIPIIRDIFSLSNPNGVILAQSGGGKSYFAKLLIARYLLNGVKVMVIDPQGEYSDLVHHFNGQRVNLSMNSKSMINPLDLMGHNYTEKRLSLMDLMPVMLGDLTEPQKSFIDKAITEAYESKGIHKNKETWDKEPPVLADILEILESMEKKAITLEKTTLRSLINRLNMYVNGVFSFLNRQTDIDFKNNFVCFDIGNMPKQVKPVIMFLVLDYVYMKMRKNLDRKLLIIDEAWSLLSRAADATYIFEIVKTCRKFNLGLLLINQEVEGLLTSEAGKSVLANSAYTLLMRQKPAVINPIKNTFHLSPVEKNYLLTANVGEGILLVDDDHTEIKVVASKEEHQIITTNPDELVKQKSGGKKMENITPNLEIVSAKIAQKEKIKPETKIPKEVKVETKPEIRPEPKKEVKPKRKYTKRVKINVTEDKRCYKKANLIPEEIDYRLRKGYHESQQWDIETGKTETYLLKPRYNESDSHIFLIYRIADFLYKHTKKVWLFETHRPDIIFETPSGKKVAIEVETGMAMKKVPKQVKAKARKLNKEFGKNWFYVITNKDYVWKYKKLGRTYTRKQILGVVKSYLKKA